MCPTPGGRGTSVTAPLRALVLALGLASAALTTADNGTSGAETCLGHVRTLVGRTEFPGPRGRGQRPPLGGGAETQTFLRCAGEPGPWLPVDVLRSEWKRVADGHAGTVHGLPLRFLRPARGHAAVLLRPFASAALSEGVDDLLRSAGPGPHFDGHALGGLAPDDPAAQLELRQYLRARELRYDPRRLEEGPGGDDYAAYSWDPETYAPGWQDANATGAVAWATGRDKGWLLVFATVDGSSVDYSQRAIAGEAAMVMPRVGRYFNYSSGGRASLRPTVCSVTVPADVHTTCQAQGAACFDVVIKAGVDACLAKDADKYAVSNFQFHTVAIAPAVPSALAAVAAVGDSGIFVNGWESRSAYQHRVLAHELGHNFGLMHSDYGTCHGCDGDDYGDYTDMMGGGLGSPNPSSLAYLGWSHPDTAVQPVAGLMTLFGGLLDVPEACGAPADFPRVLEIARGEAAPDETLFVSYRTERSYEIGIGEWVSWNHGDSMGVVVHRRDSSTQYSGIVNANFPGRGASDSQDSAWDFYAGADCDSSSAENCGGGFSPSLSDSSVFVDTFSGVALILLRQHTGGTGRIPAADVLVKTGCVVHEDGCVYCADMCRACGCETHGNGYMTCDALGYHEYGDIWFGDFCTVHESTASPYRPEGSPGVADCDAYTPSGCDNEPCLMSASSNYWGTTGECVETGEGEPACPCVERCDDTPLACAAGSCDPCPDTTDTCPGVYDAAYTTWYVEHRSCFDDGRSQVLADFNGQAAWPSDPGYSACGDSELGEFDQVCEGEFHCASYGLCAEAVGGFSGDDLCPTPSPTVSPMPTVSPVPTNGPTLEPTHAPTSDHRCASPPVFDYDYTFDCGADCDAPALLSEDHADLYSGTVTVTSVYEHPDDLGLPEGDTYAFKYRLKKNGDSYGEWVYDSGRMAGGALGTESTFYTFLVPCRHHVEWSMALLTESCADPDALQWGDVQSTWSAGCDTAAPTAAPTATASPTAYPEYSQIHVVTSAAMEPEWKAGIGTGIPYNDMNVHVGDRIRFYYDQMHDVWKINNPDCDPGVANTTSHLYSEAVMVAGPGYGGGEFHYGNKFDYVVTHEDLETGTIYFTCSFMPMYTFLHCIHESMHLTVHVSDEPRPTAMPTTTQMPSPAPSTARPSMNPTYRWTVPPEVYIVSYRGEPEWKVLTYYHDFLWYYLEFNHPSHVIPGNLIQFNFNEGTDVTKMTGRSCDGAGSELLADDTYGNGLGGFANTYQYLVTDADLAAGVIYFSCSQAPLGSFNNCGSGQKLAVAVVPPFAPSGAPTARPTGAPSGAPTSGPEPTSGPTPTPAPTLAISPTAMPTAARPPTQVFLVMIFSGVDPVTFEDTEVTKCKLALALAVGGAMAASDETTVAAVTPTGAEQVELLLAVTLPANDRDALAAALDTAVADGTLQQSLDDVGVDGTLEGAWLFDATAAPTAAPRRAPTAVPAQVPGPESAGFDNVRVTMAIMAMVVAVLPLAMCAGWHLCCKRQSQGGGGGEYDADADGVELQGVSLMSAREDAGEMKAWL